MNHKYRFPGPTWVQKKWGSVFNQFSKMPLMPDSRTAILEDDTSLLTKDPVLQIKLSSEKVKDEAKSHCCLETDSK